MTDASGRTPREWALYFQRGGHGFLSTADGSGKVSAAPYARPHVLDDGDWVFGMTDSRTLHNVLENPWALYMLHQGNYLGVRVYLERTEVERDGPLLEAVRDNVYRLVGRAAGDAVYAAVHFRVVEVRSLLGD